MAAGDRKKPNLRVVPQQTSVEYQLEALAATAAAPVPDVKPELRRDLNVSPGKGETVTVKAPESVTAFPLYKLEWGIAQLMNGKRTLAQIAAEAARVGLAATPDLVRAFARELAGYRFLIASERIGAALRSSGTAEVQPMSDEERQLLGTAMAMQGKGDIDAAVSYLLALLEINPANHTARALLRDYEHEPRVAMDEEVVTGDPEAARVRRIVLWASAGVLAAALAAGGLALWRHPEWRALLARRTAGRPAPSAAPSAPATVARARVQMQPAGRQVVAVPMDGTLRRGAGEGAAVAAGDTVAVVYKTQGYGRLVKAEAAVKKAEERADKDGGRPEAVAAAKKKLEQVRKNVKQAPVLATAAGQVHHLADDGAAVSEGGGIVELLDTSVLHGSVPVTLVPFATSGVSCTARRESGGAPIPCTARVEAPAAAPPLLRITVANPGRAVAAGEWLDLELAPAR